MHKPKKKEKHKTKQAEVKRFIPMIFRHASFQAYSRFPNSKSATLEIWFDVFTMSLEKIEVIFHFSGIKA